LGRNDNNGNVTYSYNDAAHKHAVTQVGASYFCYDANGNMTRRNATTTACTNGDVLAYDQENKLTSITVSGTTTTYQGVYPERSEGTATATASRKQRMAFRHFISAITMKSRTGTR